MSRKDTILIAVLLNAGLLIVMFVLAIKPSHVKESFVKKKIGELYSNRTSAHHKKRNR